MSDIVTISAEFKNNARQFVDLNNDIKYKKNELKKLKNDEKILSLESHIKHLESVRDNFNGSMIKFIKDNNLQESEFKIDATKLRYTTSNTTKALNKEYIYMRISEFLTPYEEILGEDVADKLTTYIMDNRPLSSREYLKSTQIRRIKAANAQASRR